jgi:hypothetical protein
MYMTSLPHTMTQPIIVPLFYIYIFRNIFKYMQGSYYIFCVGTGKPQTGRDMD